MYHFTDNLPSPIDTNVICEKFPETSLLHFHSLMQLLNAVTLNVTLFPLGGRLSPAESATYFFGGGGGGVKK